MNESAKVQLDRMKPHVQAIFDEVKRLGPEGCRAIHYEVGANLSEEMRRQRENASSDCSTQHFLAAVAHIIALEADREHAVDAALQWAQAEQETADCDAAHKVTL